MISANEGTCVVFGDVSLSVGDLLRHLHRRTRLEPLIREMAVEEFLVRHALKKGLAVSVAELQAAADQFRSCHGLHSATHMRDWLARTRLSLDDFEQRLERDLLIEKLRDHVTRDRIDAHFAVRQEAYARACLRQIVVRREDLARELLHQFEHDGRDFGELARKHSLDAAHVGGNSGWVLWRDLPPTIAEAVFSKRPGQIAGPLATPRGFHLFLIEAFAPAELDDRTTAVVRQEIFDAWLAEQLRTTPLTMPLLDDLT